MREKKDSGMGRPRVFQNPVPFEIKALSGDLVRKIDEKRGKHTSRRAYLEQLLRTHPELHDN